MLTLLLALACASKNAADTTADTSDQTGFYPPDALGPYPVGTTSGEAPGSTGLTLDEQVWYPATEAGGEPYKYLGLIQGVAYEDTPPDCSQIRPVVVFSHGNGGINVQSIFYTEWLASHGYVVVAPNHTYNTFLDDDVSKQPELVFRRPVDIEDSFDWLLTQGEAGQAYDGCIDPVGGYAVSGHSFGGYTTLAVAGAPIDIAATAAWCATNGGWLCDAVATWAGENPDVTVADLSDPRVWAAVAMSPAGYEALVGGLVQITVPTLAMVGTWDTLTPPASVETIYQGLSATPRGLAEVEKAGHYTFSDACELSPTFDDCGGDFIPPDEAHPLIDTVATAFLERVRGETREGDYLPPDSDVVTYEEVQ